jgi:predicted ATPase
MLKTIKILRDRVQNCDGYPFSVSAIRLLDEINLRSRVCLFAGENGTGKSTLLEAIAAHYGFGREGGNRNFGNDSTNSNHSIDPLVRALRLSIDALEPGTSLGPKASSTVPRTSMQLE